MMLKKTVEFLTIFILFFISSCDSQNNFRNTSQGEKNQLLKKITLSTHGSDADIWKFIAKSQAAKDLNLDIHVKEISEGIENNTAVSDGQVDVNAFQSWAYLKVFNQNHGNKLVALATTYYEPMGLYSTKIKDLSQIKNGAVIAIPNNAANTARALKLLESAGLIVLKNHFNDVTGSIDDIAENPKSLKIILISEYMGARILKDVDLVAIGNTIALEGGLNVLRDAIFHEENNESIKSNINVLAVLSARVNDVDLVKLAKLYHSKEVKDYIAKNLGGTKVLVDQPVSYLLD